MQHVEVCVGGTLTEDMPTLIPDEIDHGKFNGKHSMSSVRVNKESLLCDIIGSQTIDVASTHHQAIKSLGREAKVTASADDKVVEAIESKNKNNFIGVQWHPELLRESKESKKIFSWLKS